MNAFELYQREEPHVVSLKQTYAEASRELLLPHPATPIREFPRFSRLIGGLRPREYSILCGATGVGKTTLMANISKSLVLQEVPHFVASVETGKNDFVKRVMSAMANEDWNTGDPIQVSKLKELHTSHGNYLQSETLWLSLYENRFSVEKLMNDIAWAVKHKGCKVAIVDNLNFFMEVTRAADQLIEMDRVTHELIIFCKRIDVHVIMVMHPKKTESGRVTSEFDIKGSSTAVQEAHNVFLFNRVDSSLVRRGLATRHDREITIAKLRRRGKATGSRLVLTTLDGTTYQEGALV